MKNAIRIGIIGDYQESRKSHVAMGESIKHAADHLEVDVESIWLPTPDLEANVKVVIDNNISAVWCAPGSPYKSYAGALSGIRYARENRIPFIGTCGGFQHAVLEYAVNVLGIKNAGHAELDPLTISPVISSLQCSLVGQTRTVNILPETLSYSLYGATTTDEQFTCSYGLNTGFLDVFLKGGLRLAGQDENLEPRILECPANRFYIITLFLPQLSSSPTNPHPLIIGWLKATMTDNHK
jgi:CTP synthase (UTP-ammonia lyase)